MFALFLLLNFSFQSQVLRCVVPTACARCYDRRLRVADSIRSLPCMHGRRDGGRHTPSKLHWWSWSSGRPAGRVRSMCSWGGMRDEERPHACCCCCCCSYCSCSWFYCHRAVACCVGPTTSQRQQSRWSAHSCCSRCFTVVFFWWNNVVVADD